MARKRTPPPAPTIPVRSEWRFEAAKPEEIVGLPPPADGQLGFVYCPGDDHRSTALQWTGRNGELVWEKTGDWLLAYGDPGKATWLPDGWTIYAYPIGWTREHLDSWFRYADSVAQDLKSRPDPRPNYHPTHRMLVHHAYLIADHLQHTPLTPEAQVPADLDGSLAALADLRRLLIGTPKVGGQGEGATNKKREKGRGAPKQYCPKADRRLCEDWKAAKAEGMKRKDWTRARGISIQELIDAQHREKYRRKRDAE